jgi:hypothetical protein
VIEERSAARKARLGSIFGHWLRGVAAKCRLSYTQKELLDLAQRYDTMADRIGRRPAVR